VYENKDVCQNKTDDFSYEESKGRSINPFRFVVFAINALRFLPLFTFFMVNPESKTKRRYKVLHDIQDKKAN
jgi:hypothetical protein|tara:strand:+ start:470 stop:685 length:216 start_codon:yes stop_codon:yes gene_type:complete